MQRTNVLVSLLLLLLFSCNNNKPAQSILTTRNLKSTFIALISDSAYTLKTPKGAIIKIDAKSFAVSSNTKLLLEIKEAYTLQDILLAGLTTESNCKPLKSGGMIYINATVDGKSIELLQPIKISIPTEAYDDNMQLFKGEINENSTINWIDSQPLDTTLTAKNLQLGNQLFKANCASCHKTNKEFVAPMLAHCRERTPDRDWSYRFTVNTNIMLEKDRYARNLLKKYGSKMSQFNLSRKEVNAIFDYCDNEAALNPFNANTLPVPPQKNDTIKPCGYDTIYYAKPDTGIVAITSDNTIADTFRFDNISMQKAEDMEGLRKGFTDPNQTSGVYDFSIITLGWYNVDALVEGYAGSTYVSVNVQLQIEIESEMHVYLFCPDKKMLSVGIKHAGNNYAFDKIDGKIPLFLNDKALILAFGSKGEKIFYGTASFNIKSAQTITITVKETTETQLQSFIQKNKIDGIEIDLNKKEDFKIKEKPCDGVYKTDSATVTKKK